MRCPGVLPAGVVWQSGVSLVDLMPTILEAARVVPAIRGGEIHGRSLLPDLRAGRDRWRGPILMQNIPQRGIDGSYYDERALRTERWKLILRKFDARPELRPGELYDLQADPEENRNLYGSNRESASWLGPCPAPMGRRPPRPLVRGVGPLGRQLAATRPFYATSFTV